MIIEINECPVLTEGLGELIGLLRDYLPLLVARQAVSHAELLQADNGRAVLLRLIRALPEKDRALLKAFAEAHLLRLFLQDNDCTVTCLYTPDDEPYLYYLLSDGVIKLCYTPVAFTQVNTHINRQMVAQALGWLDVQPGQRILDLFCGLGNFSLALGGQGAFVKGIEGGESAVVSAKKNAALNGLNHCAFYQADLSKDFCHRDWAKATYDALLPDPPRAGAQSVITALKNKLPSEILYISCNPATLARDAALLKAEGFILRRLGVMDMFPQTAHIESMALFAR